jgi:hypothetical protein
MNKNLVAALLVIIIGACSVFYYMRMPHTPIVVTPAPAGISTEIVYNNTQYGFSFTLPATWQGYSIVDTTWQGTPATSTAPASGPKILIRHPKWTTAVPYEDLPILVFTLDEWDSYVGEQFSVSAAPIQATELGRNNKYVFALPPRWDFDYSQGFAEAQAIFAGKPPHTFSVMEVGAPQAKLNINVVCEKALDYMKFTDAKSADAFVVDCVAGKHPEVIEKYKADLNLGAGVAI